MLLNDLAGRVDSRPPKAVVRRQFDFRLQPELCLATGMLHVHVRPGVFP